MSKSHRHTEKHAKKPPAMTPKERRQAKLVKKHERDIVPLIPH